MRIVCKRCGCEALMKSGFVSGKQRYRCKSCGMHFTEGDKRRKYSERLISAAVELYLEGNGFRRISRLLWKIFKINVCHQLVIKWIRSAAKEIERKSSKNVKMETPVLEVDELFTYVKKNRTKSEYGLLLIETGCVLLDLKSETQV